MELKHRPSRFDYSPPSLNCRTLAADRGGRTAIRGCRPTLFDILFMSTPPSPVGSSLPLTDANVFADALGVAPVYRQKEQERQSSQELIHHIAEEHDADVQVMSTLSGVSRMVEERKLPEGAKVLKDRSEILNLGFTINETSGRRDQVKNKRGTKRWSSALQLYRQMSNHDIAEHASRQQHTGAPNDFQEECISDDGGAAGDHRFGRSNFRCRSPHLRSSSTLSGVLSLENLINSKIYSASYKDVASPHQRSPSYEGNILDRSADASGNASPGESSLNSLELEAIAAVHELHFAVRDISVSDLLPRTSELIFLNITTLEGQAYCIELTMKGWRVTSLRHDCMNGDLAHLDLHTFYFETVYSLMDTISACYRQRFADLLALRLRQVHATSGSDSHLVSMPEDLSGSNSSTEASHSPRAPSRQWSEERNEASTPNERLMILDDSDYGRPITINIRRSASGEGNLSGTSDTEHMRFRPGRQ